VRPPIRLSPVVLFVWGCGRTISTADASTDLAAADRAKDESSADLPDFGATTYDLGRDFSFSQNPNGPWRYGYTAGATLSVEAFQLDTVTVVSAPVGFWHPADGDAGYYPYVAENSASTLMTDPTDSWAVQPGQVAMEGSSGQYSVVQFVVPSSADYDIEADFAGIHVRLSTTDVHVLINDISAFDAQIDGYGGDPSFHAVEGQSPQAGYRETRALQAGDLLSFAVGVGSNGTNANDTTGLFVHLTAH
jgi:hypothetical protein